MRRGTKFLVLVGALTLIPLYLIGREMRDERLGLFVAMGGAVVLQLLKFPVAAIVDMQRLWGVLTQLVVTGASGVAVYGLVCWLLEVEELRAIYRYVPRRWRLKVVGGLDTERFAGLSE